MEPASPAFLFALALPDLLLRAKHLFVAAIDGWVHRGLAPNRQRDSGGGSRSEPVQFSRDQQSKAPDAGNAAAEGDGLTGSPEGRRFNSLSQQPN
jgi:hypothetical protein